MVINTGTALPFAECGNSLALSCFEHEVGLRLSRSPQGKPLLFLILDLKALEPESRSSILGVGGHWLPPKVPRNPQEENTQLVFSWAHRGTCLPRLPGKRPRRRGRFRAKLRRLAARRLRMSGSLEEIDSPGGIVGMLCISYDPLVDIISGIFGMTTFEVIPYLTRDHINWGCSPSNHGS